MTRFETIIAQEGDTIDLIAFRRFGATAGRVEAILDFNPGLAAVGPILPIGFRVRVPVPEVKDRRQSNRLWG